MMLEKPGMLLMKAFLQKTKYVEKLTMLTLIIRTIVKN